MSSVSIDDDPWIDLALSELVQIEAANWSAARKAKSVQKFGQRDDLGTSKSLLWQVGPVEETLPAHTANVIDTISSSSTSDVGTLIYLEGHYWDATLQSIVFGSEIVALNGRNQVPLSRGYCRASRLRSFAGVVCVGDVWVYQSGQTVTNGVPQDLTKTHICIKAGGTRSFKGSTSLSGVDAAILIQKHISINKKTSAGVDFILEIKRMDRSAWEPLVSGHSLATPAQTFANVANKPYFIIPPLFDIRVAAIGSTTAIQAGVTFFMVLANKTTGYSRFT